MSGRGLLNAESADAFDRLATELIAKAGALGRSAAANRVLAQRGDERRWRRVDLLWPTVKG